MGLRTDSRVVGRGHNMIRLAIAGATGRTGRSVLERALGDDRFTVAAALSVTDDPACGSNLRAGSTEVPITDRLEAACDVLVDFTVAAGTMAWIDVCTDRKVPMVTGVTGHDEHQLARIREASATIPIVKATNFSIGINVLLNMIGRLAKELGDDYDVEIAEAHHRHKVDAPSGTALTFLDELLAATGRTRADHAVFGRHGPTGERPPGQIAVHALRLGEMVGHHEIHFGGPGETITLRHTAHSRDTFAAGALRAAAWIVGRKPGLYTMRDVMS